MSTNIRTSSGTWIPVVPSPDGTIVQAPTTQTLTDAAGIVWGINAQGQVTMNGAPDASTWGVTALGIKAGVVEQTNGTANYDKLVPQWTVSSSPWVQASAPQPPAPPPQWYDGVFRLNSAQRLCNAAGVPGMVRGVNTPMDSQITNGYWDTNPGGAYFGFDGPSFPALVQMGYNAIRVTINANALLNQQIGVLAGTWQNPEWEPATIPADRSNGGYFNYIKKMIALAHQYQIKLNVDMHWDGPEFTLPQVGAATGAPKLTRSIGGWNQPPFISKNGAAAWALLFPLLGPADTVEIFNEPYLGVGGLEGASFNTEAGGAGTPLTYQQVMCNGGWISCFDNQNDNSSGPNGYGSIAAVRAPPMSGSGVGYFQQWWYTPGYAAIVNAARAAGFTGLILCNTTGFAHQLSDLDAIVPPDPLNNIGSAIHEYEYGNSGYPYAGHGALDKGQNGQPSAWNIVFAVINGTAGLSRPYYLEITEFGPENGAGPGAPNPSPFMQNTINVLSSAPAGSIGAQTWVYQPAAYPTSGTTSWDDFAYQMLPQVQANLTGNQLVLSALAPAGFGPGTVLLSGGQIWNNSTLDRPYVVSGAGAAWTISGNTNISPPLNFTAANVQPANLVPSNGQGSTWVKFLEARGQANP